MEIISETRDGVSVVKPNSEYLIAGNVDDVSLIQKLSDYGVTVNGGVLGASKTVYYNPLTGVDQPTAPDGTPLSASNLNYVNYEGYYTNNPLPGGGELIDGAVVSIIDTQKPSSIRDFSLEGQG